MNKPFFTVVGVGLIVWCYQTNEIVRRRDEQNREKREKISLELDNRIETEKTRGSALDAVNAKAYLDGTEGDPLFPEFRNQSFQSLLTLLGYYVPAVTREKLKCAAQEWRKLPTAAKNLDKREVDRIRDAASDVIHPLLPY